MMLHQFAQQPWGDLYQPGITMGQWGTHFTENQTWWKLGKAWVDYLSRCQALLQWGEIAMPVMNDFSFETSNKVSDIKFPVIQAIHRRKAGTDVFFLANFSKLAISAKCKFGTTQKQPELWNPVNGTKRDLPQFSANENGTAINLKFAPGESCFVVFRKPISERSEKLAKSNFPELQPAADLSSAWQVQFDPKWGGPKQPLQFDSLEDWTRRPEPGVKYFSGTAVYTRHFDVSPDLLHSFLELDLGTVHHLARVKINNVDLGVVWTAPWRLAIPAGLLKTNGNDLVIEVANVWANRLIGDEQEPDDCQWTPGPRGNGRFLKEFPDWLVKKQPRPSKGRYTFTTWNYFNKDSQLVSSGLLGPVTLLKRCE
jgi:hypothetical protein